MDEVNLGLKLYTNKADDAIAASAKKGRDLFEKRGFNLNLKSSNLPLGRITGDFDKFSGSLDAATARVLAFTATTTVVYGLSTAFSRLFTDSIKLEKQLASIQSILQTSNSNLQKFSSELFNVANATGQSFDVAAAAASEFARQGLSVEETLKATNAALTFSKIAGTDAAQTVENLTAALNTFANESLNYTDVLDTIVSLDNAFAISAAGISDGLKRVGSVASESGIQLKEIASLIAVVQQVSARGAPVISNGLKTIFTRLSRTSVQEALNNIGVATQNSNGEFRSQIEVLTDLANRLDSLSDSQRAFVLEQVAGVYQINTLQATLKSLSGEYSLFDKAVKVASDSSGNAANRLKILTDTTDANLQRLKNNVTQFLAEVGKTTVKPILDNFVGIGNKILETLDLGAAGEAGEKAGNSIGTYLLNGLSSVLSGPGTVLLVVGLGKLLTKVTKDAFIAVQTLAGLKQTSLVDEKVQSSINKAIETGNRALVDRLATTTSIVEKARILKNLMADMDRAQGVAQIEEAVSTGLRVNRKNIQPKGKNKAEGFIPTYSRGFIPDSMQRLEKKGAMAGGYSPKKVIAAPDSIGGVMNKAESLVSMEGMKQPFINPPKNSKAGRKHRKKAIEQTGIDPYALMSEGGFIPNFAYQVDKQNLGKNQVITINGFVNGRQSSLVADNNNKAKDKVENLKYKVRQIENPYENNFKKSVSEYKDSGYQDSNWQAIESQLKDGKYTEEQIKTFKENLDSKETTGKSLITGKDVRLDRQVTGIQSKLKGAFFENVVGNSLAKAISRKKVKVPVSQNSRMDLLNSKDYSLGEIKSGKFSYDNLASKAIASLSEEKDEKYLDGGYDNIKFEKPYSLFVPAPTPKSSGGFIPNFASRYTEARKQKRDQLRASLFNIGDFAGGAIKNINARTEFDQARNKNPNVEFDDKINQVGFKVERIPIPDREFEAALRSKENNKEVTTKFENYAIDYLNGKGYSFKAGRNTLYGKENAAVDGYNIKQNFIELLEVKGGKWDAPDVNNKFGRFAPENLVDLGPQLVSKFFKEGNPDPSINDKIRIRNVLAIPNLTGGVFKKNIAPQYPSADVKTIEKARQSTRPSGKKTPANMAWMLGVVKQMKESGATNASGFIPNFNKEFFRDVVGNKESGKNLARNIDRKTYDFLIAKYGREEVESNLAKISKTPPFDFVSEEDKQYKEAVQKNNTDLLKKMLAKKVEDSGFNRRGVRLGFYHKGVPLPPEIIGPNFGPGYYTAEDASLSVKGGDVSVDEKPNKARLNKLGLKASDVQYRKDEVYVKAQNPLQGNLPDEFVPYLKARVNYETAVNDAYSKLGKYGHLDPDEIAKLSGRSELLSSLKGRSEDHEKYKVGTAILMKEGKIPYDSIRGIGGRALQEKTMSSELVVQNASQIKSAALAEYDDDGHLIPLSKRFDETSDDIRGSKNPKKKRGRGYSIESLGLRGKPTSFAKGFIPNFVNPGEKAVFPRTFDASTGTFKSPSGVSNIATLLNLLGAFTGDATLGNVLNGFETEMVVKTIMGSSQFLAAYAGEKGVGNLVGDAGKYGLKVTNSLQDRLRKIGKKISFGGGRTRKTSAEGFIPNFASRLSYKEIQKAQKEAINREVASGQKRKDVKVGKSNSLKTSFNPMGFGVFNKYEKTLANGMGLAKKEGIDPRSKGMFASKGFVPNFAKNDDGSGFFIGSLKKAWLAYEEFLGDTAEMIQKVASGKLNTPSRQGFTIGNDDQKKSYSVLKEIADGIHKIEQDESLSNDYAENFTALRDKREKSGTLGKEGGMEVKGSESRNLAADETRTVRKTLAEAKKGTQRRVLTYDNPEVVGLSKENDNISVRKKISDQKDLITSNPELLSQYQKNIQEVQSKQIPTGEQFIPGLEGGMKDKKSRARNLAAIETRVIRKTIADSKKQASQNKPSNQASPSLPNIPNSPIPDNYANISAADRMRGVKPINNPSSVPTFPSSTPPLRPPGGGGPPTPPGLPSPTEKDKKSKGKGLRGSGLSNAKLGAAGALAFSIPSVTGALSTPAEGKEQTTTQKNIQAGGEAVGAGLAAATTTALIPGLAPIAPVVGVAVTAFKLLTAASKNAVPSIESITKQNQKLIASNEKQLTSLDSAVQKTQEISQLKSSGADPKKIAKAEIELSKSLIGIGDEGLVNTLKNEKNDTKKQEAILAFQEKKTKEKNLSESLTGAATLSQQAQTERAGGFMGTIGSSLDIAAQVTEFFGGKGAAEFVKPVSELIKGPKQDFGTEQWDQFINPIIDSLDLSKLTSEDAAKGLKRLAGGTQDLGSFIRQFGAEAGMSSSQIQQITQSLNSLSSAYSPESISSLNQYTGGVIKLNQQLASNAVAKNTPVVNVNFQKVFEKALQDLTLDTALTNYKQFSDKGSNLTISKNQLALDQQAGKFSQTQGIRKQSQMQGQEDTLRFNKEGTDIVTSAVEKLLAIIPDDLNNDQRSAIVQESKNVLTRGGDLTKLEDLIRDSVANSGKSNDILEEIAKINEETTQSVEKLKTDRSAATKTRTAVEEANVQAAQDAAASQRGADIISGAAAQAPKGKLLDVKLLAENNAKIEKLTAQAQLAGGNRTERGRSIISQANALELQNARMREQDLIAQSTAFGAPNVTGQEQAQAANKAIGDKDFAKNLAAETGNLLQQLNASKAQKGQRQLFSSKDIKSITQGIEIGGEGATQARALIESKLGDTSAESQVNQDIINRVKTLGGENSIFNDKKPPAEEPRPAWEAATQRLAQESLTGRMGSDELLRSQTTGLKDQAVSEAEAAKKEADAAREALGTFSAKETEAGKSKAAQTGGANRLKIQNLEESLGNVGRTTWEEKGLLGKAGTVAANVTGPGLLYQGIAALGQKAGIMEDSAPLFGDYGLGQKKQSPEAQQTSADLSSFLDKIKSGNATKSDFEALKKSLDDKGRSTEDIADRQKFIKGVEDLQIPFAEDNQATLAEKKKNLETVANEKQAIADQKNAAAEVAKKNVENFAGDPSQTLKFLQNPEQKADALRKLKESKDPNLKSLGEKITSLDLKKEELKKIKDQEELSGLAFSKTPLNEQQMKRKAELESAGVKAEELSTSQKDRKKELEAGIGKDTNAIIAEGKRSYGAINSTLYKDQVAPGVLDLVQKPEDKAKVESYNAKVLERQAQESQLSTTNEEITGIQAQEAQRRKVSSAFLADTGSSMSLDEKYAVTSRFNKGEITAEQANEQTGGALKNAYKSVTNKEEGFENLNNIGNIQTKLGNRERLQQGVEKAKAEESELSKAMQPVLEAITGFANAQAAATEAQTAAAQEEKAKKEAGQEAGTSTAEGGEKKITATSNINVTVTGGSLTDSHVAQLEQNLKTYSVETVNIAFKNAGLPAPNLGPVETTAVA